MLWLHLKDAPRRMSKTAVLIGSKIYSFGADRISRGYSSIDSIDVCIFDMNTLRWSLPLTEINADASLPIYHRYLSQRFGHTVVAYQGKAYMWGGCSYQGICSADILYCFSPETLSWTCMALSGTIPYARERHTACMIDHWMVIFGGFVYGLQESPNEVYCLDLKALKWKCIQTFGTAPSFRLSHSAVGLNGRMYIFGGISYSGIREDMYTSDIFYLDVQTKEWNRPLATGTVPAVRRSCSMFIYNELIYIFGGHNSHTKQHFNDLHIFDPKSDTWKLVTPLGRPPSARMQSLCVIKDDRMFLIGGNNRNAYRFSLIIYNDMYALNFKPTLRCLAMAAVVELELDTSILPKGIQEDIRLMKPATPLTSSSSESDVNVEDD